MAYYRRQSGCGESQSPGVKYPHHPAHWIGHRRLFFLEILLPSLNSMRFTGKPAYRRIDCRSGNCIGSAEYTTDDQQYGGCIPDQRAQQYLDMVGNRLVQGTGAGRPAINLISTYSQTLRLSMPLPYREGRSSLQLPFFTIGDGRPAGWRYRTRDRTRTGQAWRRADRQTTTHPGTNRCGRHCFRRLQHRPGRTNDCPVGQHEIRSWTGIAIRWPGVRLMMETGYNPEDMIGVMEF